ncbi:unnamed protein product [Cladocopium goreaui]|uniref:Altered inheritance rate of mitochondria protein 25 n=1 Tax=Cladocopium goreaui TaxID=2562237 RepID=A0A9P1CUK5_9DINO|nr:unnamed protein product [Cladocopium goreaui]
MRPPWRCGRQATGSALGPTAALSDDPVPCRPPPDSCRRVFGLLRTTLALMVMVYHLLASLPEIGQYAVFGFYVISGYLMTLVTTERYGHTVRGGAAFLTNRALRIYPGYLAAVAVSLACVLVVGDGFTSAYNRNMGAPATLAGWLSNLSLGFPGWNPMEARPRLVPPAWTLTVEMLFYAAIGCGLATTPRRVGVWIAGSLAYVLATFALGLPNVHRYAPVAAASLPFAIGAAAYHLSIADTIRLHAHAAAYARLAYFVLLSNCAFFALGGADSIGVARDVGLYVNTAISGILVLSLARGGQIAPISAGLDRAVGDYSYPVYLLHWQGGLIASLLLFGSPVRGWSPQGLIGFVAAGVIVAVGSWLMINAVERPMQGLRDRVRRRAQPRSEEPRGEAFNQGVTVGRSRGKRGAQHQFASIFVRDANRPGPSRRWLRQPQHGRNVPGVPAPHQPKARDMHPVLNRELFLVKEKVGAWRAANHYDIYDPESGELLLECREPRLGPITSLLRWTDYKTSAPFDIDIRTPSGEPIVSVQRGWAWLRSNVSVLDGQDRRVGGFQQKLFSIGGAFTVVDEADKPLCELKGKWTSWEFSFRAGDAELAKVTKKWAGLGKEMFTSADNYMLQVNPQVPPDSVLRQLILAAVVCIDMVLKE